MEKVLREARPVDCEAVVRVSSRACRDDGGNEQKPPTNEIDGGDDRKTKGNEETGGADRKPPTN